MKKILLLLCLASLSAKAVSVIDDDGRAVTLSDPAKRIVSTAPHITEFLYEVGAGEHIVGATRYSNYPAPAQSIPVVGDSRQIDVERVLALKPDLLIAWRGGNPVRQVAQLAQWGIPVFYSDPKSMDDIPGTLMRFGVLTGRDAQGKERAQAAKARLEKLRKQYEKRRVLKVFYQVSERPLYTLNGRHIVSEAIRICGGRNIFSELRVIAPRVSVEAVLEKNPDVIFISRSGGSAEGVDFWRRFGIVEAVRQHHLFEVDPDVTDRPGPRLIDGVGALCEKMDEARRNGAGR